MLRIFLAMTGLALADRVLCTSMAFFIGSNGLCGCGRGRPDLGGLSGIGRDVQLQPVLAPASP